MGLNLATVLAGEGVTVNTVKCKYLTYPYSETNRLVDPTRHDRVNRHDSHPKIKVIKNPPPTLIYD